MLKLVFNILVYSELEMEIFTRGLSTVALYTLDTPLVI